MRVESAIVIGAGHSGLVCAIRLAGAGVGVTVLEQAEQPGGAVSSGADTLPGFVHDRCAGFFPLTLASPAFAGLGVRERVEWVNPPAAMTHPFADGSAIVLHREVEQTVASLEAVAPGAGRRWRKLVAQLDPRRDLVLRAALSTFPPLGAAAGLGAHLRLRGFEFARLAAGSAATLGIQGLGHPRAGAWMAGSAVHSDLSPTAALSGAFALGLKLLGHWVGWPYPRGGAATLTEALVARLRELGGELRCGAGVEQIVVRDGRATGVRLASGEELRSGAVVSTLSAGRLAALLPAGALPGRLERRLAGWRYGIGTFKADYALSGPVPWTAPAAREAGAIHLGDTLEHFTRSQQEAGLGVVPREPALVVGQHTVHDPDRAPPGGHTLYVYTHVPHRPGMPDEEIAERIEARVEAFAPGFRALVLGRALRSPATLERENTNLVGGDLGGGSYEIDQQLLFRPAPELVRHRAPLRGLYVGGASVHPGGGVHGVTGDGAARALLADRAGWRFWR